MPIFAKNFTVGVAKTAPTDEKNGTQLKTISELLLKDQSQQKVKKVNLDPQVTKELPKYVAKEDGELTRKINTKSQYMRDIFDLDS